MFSNRKDQVAANKLESSHELSLAEEFVQVYFDKLDKQQYPTVSRLYLPDALLVWNGIATSGADKIQQFLSQLPPSSHTIMSIDSQRMQENASGNKSFLIQIGGVVRYKDYSSKQFFQTFFTTMTEGKYKITVDHYRCLGGTP
ncbi:hypothetical protein V9T40_008788 [Parthenolecanium corni]|uniref:NTF2-related export protein n=1 Tax=Parthenolecanium corni TaxID=536013 RepID=A0AAN9TP91_9HEMI